MRLIRGRKEKGIDYNEHPIILDGIFFEGLKEGILKELKRKGITDILRLDVKLKADVIYVTPPIKMLSKRKRHELRDKLSCGLFKPYRFNKDDQIECARCGKMLYPEEMHNSFHSPLCAKCATDRARHAIPFENCF